MTKAEMIREMIVCGCYWLVVNEYVRDGYPRAFAVAKTVEYVSRKHTRAQIKALYDDVVKEV